MKQEHKAVRAREEEEEIEEMPAPDSDLGLEELMDEGEELLEIIDDLLEEEEEQGMCPCGAVPADECPMSGWELP